MKKAIYISPLDPITIADEDVILRARNLFDEITLVFRETDQGLFSCEQRMAFAKKTFEEYDDILCVKTEGRLIEYRAENNIIYQIRSIDSIRNLESSQQMNELIKSGYPQMETVFFDCTPKYRYLTSATIKEIFSFDGEYRDYLPKRSADMIVSAFEDIRKNR